MILIARTTGERATRLSTELVFMKQKMASFEDELRHLPF